MRLPVHMSRENSISSQKTPIAMVNMAMTTPRNRFGRKIVLTYWSAESTTMKPSAATREDENACVTWSHPGTVS